ncbi:uncharacterized protein LOC121707575 [Alosa sapidissima]|uniref:uncharacterized protein LOC121707575 n=1 Tax=Alosa sapidissima TaxID=34773 RepID=UPI001C0943C5|nr:uncharacterized protein LOC121707575 [Alosa sapidissima]
MSVSSPLTGSLPLKKRTQRQGSPSGYPLSPGQQQQQSSSPPPPPQPEHKFKVPAPYRNPSRVSGVRDRERARPDRSLSSLVTPTPLYYQFWDKSYLAVPRNHSSVSSLASSGHSSAMWRERYPGNSHSGEWMHGRHIQEELPTPPGASLHLNYLSRHPSTAPNMQYAYRDSLLLGGHRRPKVNEAESMAFHTHRGLGSASPYESSGVPSWDRWLVPPVRTNHLLHGPARVSCHDSIRRRRERERYLGEEEYSKATVARRTASPVDGKAPHATTSAGLLYVSDSSRAAKEYLSSHAAGFLSGKSKRRQETPKNSEELPLLVGSGSAAEAEQQSQSRKHRTEAKSLSPSTPSASVLSLCSLQHFAVGSLIELSGGRCKRVEDLQTEDFLLSADTCPEVRLRSCTVRHIAPSPSSPDLAQVVILLDDQHTQDCLEVYVGFPFFVCGRGWASCCPQMTTRLCGLGCHQLGVGDVCLALSPIPGTRLQAPAKGTSSGPQELQEQREGEGEKKEMSSQGMAEAAEKERTGRKRHSSAPELCTMDWSEHLKKR